MIHFGTFGPKIELPDAILLALISNMLELRFLELCYIWVRLRQVVRPITKIKYFLIGLQKELICP